MADIDSKDLKVDGKYPNWYNSDQTQALDKMVDFTHDSKRHKFVLEGAAGTGKTTIIKEFRKHCASRSGFIVAAPTHKAVRVISQAVGAEGYTVQKLLGLRPNFNIDNFDPTRIQFDPYGKRNIELYNTIVIDEASMLPRKLVNYLDEEAIKHGVHLVYTGDPYQLPPVMDSTSPAFNVPLKDKAVLSQIMRQGDDNPLSPLLAEIRWAIQKKNFNYINNLINKRIIKGGKGFIHADAHTFQDYAYRAFNHDTFKANIDWCKIVTYTNDNVAIWNKYVRDRIFPDHHNEAIIVHDLFTCYTTIVDEFNDPKITNSEEYIVEDHHAYRNKYGISGWMVKFQEVSTGAKTPFLFVVNHQDDANMASFVYQLQLKMAAASDPTNSPSTRSKKWGEFYEFKNDNLIMVDVKNPNDPKRNLVDKDLDYGYAITSHKSQGSTYGHVFVNLANILYGNGNKHVINSAEMTNRLFYVAASRAKETLTILF